MRVQFSSFIARYPELDGVISRKWYAVFHNLLEDPGFATMMTPDIKQELSEDKLYQYLDAIHPIYHADHLYYQISPDNHTENLPTGVSVLAQLMQKWGEKINQVGDGKGFIRTAIVPRTTISAYSVNGTYLVDQSGNPQQ